MSNGDFSNGSSTTEQSCHRIPQVIRVPMLPPPRLAEQFRDETLREDVVYEFYLPLPEASYRATVHWMRTLFSIWRCTLLDGHVDFVFYDVCRHSTGISTVLARMR